MSEVSGTKSATKKGGRTTEGIKKSHIKGKNRHFESICDEIIEFQRTGHYNLMYIETKKRLGSKSGYSERWH
jgi:hypothetical protein